jgi:hypothetical protein
MGNHVSEGGNRIGAERVGEAPVRPDEMRSLAEAVILLRDHPYWAIWLPVSGRDWTAVRPASSRPPAPELPMMWVHADTASELARLMDAMDVQISAGGWPGHECGQHQAG